jgi:hypothetical protein
MGYPVLLSVTPSRNVSIHVAWGIIIISDVKHQERPPARRHQSDALHTMLSVEIEKVMPYPLLSHSSSFPNISFRNLIPPLIFLLLLHTSFFSHHPHLIHRLFTNISTEQPEDADKILEMAMTYEELERAHQLFLATHEEPSSVFTLTGLSSEMDEPDTDNIHKIPIPTMHSMSGVM